jgi:hypothetical protein
MGFAKVLITFCLTAAGGCELGSFGNINFSHSVGWWMLYSYSVLSPQQFDVGGGGEQHSKNAVTTKGLVLSSSLLSDRCIAVDPSHILDNNAFRTS